MAVKRTGTRAFQLGSNFFFLLDFALLLAAGLRGSCGFQWPAKIWYPLSPV